MSCWLRIFDGCFAFSFQLRWHVRVSLLTVLLLQALKHVRPSAESGVFRLHDSDVLRILSHAGYRVFLRVVKVPSIYLC